MKKHFKGALTVAFLSFVGLLVAFLGMPSALHAEKTPAEWGLVSVSDATNPTTVDGHPTINSKYSFIANFIPGPQGTKMTPLGPNAKWTYFTDPESGTSVSGNENAQYGVEATPDQKGKVGLIYSNVGSFNGQQVDLKVTATDWLRTLTDRPTDTPNNLHLAFSGNKIGFLTLNQSVAFKFTYLVHSTDFANPKELPLSGYMTFNDIDSTQGMYIPKATLGLSDQVIVNNKATSRLGVFDSKTGKGRWYYDKVGETHLADDLDNSFTLPYNTTSTFDWAFSASSGTLDMDTKVAAMGYTDDLKPTDAAVNISTAPYLNLLNNYYGISANGIAGRNSETAPIKHVYSDDNTQKYNTNSDLDGKVLDRYLQKFRYDVQFTVPSQDPEDYYAQWAMQDVLDSRIHLQNDNAGRDVTIYDDQHNDVTDKYFTNRSSGNTVRFEANSTALRDKTFYNSTYHMVMHVMMHEGQGSNSVPNTAQQITDRSTQNSNQVVVTPPATVVEKTSKHMYNTSGVQYANDTFDDNGGAKAEQPFNFKITGAVPNDKTLNDVAIYDELPIGLEVNDDSATAIQVYDITNTSSLDNSNNISSKGKTTITSKGATGTKLPADVSTAIEWKAADPQSLEGHTIVMVLKTHFVKDADMRPVLIEGKNYILNHGYLRVNGDHKPYIPPKILVDFQGTAITKWVIRPATGAGHEDLTDDATIYTGKDGEDLHTSFGYRYDIEVGNETANDEVLFSDKFEAPITYEENSMDVKDVTDPDAPVSPKGIVKWDTATNTLTWKASNPDALYGHRLQVRVKAHIKDGGNTTDGLQSNVLANYFDKLRNQFVIPNVANVQVKSNGPTYKSNTVYVRASGTKPTITKHIMGKDGKLYDDYSFAQGESYSYQIDATVGNVADLKSVVITDNLEKALQFEKLQVFDMSDLDAAKNPRDVTAEGTIVDPNKDSGNNSNTVSWVANSEFAGKLGNHNLRAIMTVHVRNGIDLSPWISYDGTGTGTGNTGDGSTNSSNTNPDAGVNSGDDSTGAGTSRQ